MGFRVLGFTTADAAVETRYGVAVFLYNPRGQNSDEIGYCAGLNRGIPLNNGGGDELLQAVKGGAPSIVKTNLFLAEFNDRRINPFGDEFAVIRHRRHIFPGARIPVNIYPKYSDLAFSLLATLSPMDHQF